MKKKIRFLNSLRLKVLLSRQLLNVTESEKRVKQKVLSALDGCKRGIAEQYFPILLEWNDLRKATAMAIDRVSNVSLLTYVVDSWFLQDLLDILTPDSNEVPVYITGPEVGGIKILSRICRFTLDHRSVIRAQGNPRACSDALIDINDHGNALHAMAHSHPGAGAEATHESGIDTKYLGNIQKAGADTIGLILTRDGHVRFFSVHREFQVFVRGKGINHVQKNVYKLQV